MSVLPERSLERRLLRMERRIAELEQANLQAEAMLRRVEPIAGRLWLCTLNEDMGETTSGEAAADLLSLDTTDTAKDITVVDPHDLFGHLEDGAEGLCVEQLDTDGTRYFVLVYAQYARAMTELMLAEDHPGKGIVFKCYRGIWCSEDHTWRYDCTDVCADWAWAIDHRYDVPYPDIGARGLFTPRPSDTYGTIWECLSLDCSSPGACADQSISQPCPGSASTNYGGAC